MAALLLSVCASSAELPAGRRSELVARYPPGKTTVLQVHASLGEAPLSTPVRSDAGWAAANDSGAVTKALDC